MKFKKIHFRILISILFLIFLFYFVRPGKIIDALQGAEISWIIFAILLLPINVCFQFFRWQILVKNLNTDIGNGEILKSIFYSYSYSIFTPARLGDLGKAFHISHDNKKEMVALAVLEKVFAFSAILIFGFLSLTIFKSIWFIFGSFIIVLVLLNSKKIIRKISFISKHFSNPQILPIKNVFIVSLSFVFIYILQFYLLLRAFQLVSFSQSFFKISLVVFFNSVPITLSGLGVREILSVYFFKPLGVTAAQAASVSLLIFTINILIPTLVGFVLHLLPPKKIESPYK